MNVFYDVKHPSREDDQSVQQSPMVTVILILPLEETTVKLTIDSRSNSGVKVEQQQFNFKLFVPFMGLT